MVVPLAVLAGVLLAFVGLGLGLVVLVLSPGPSRAGRGRAVAGAGVSLLALVGAVGATAVAPSVGATGETADRAGDGATPEDEAGSAPPPDQLPPVVGGGALPIGRSAEVGSEWTVVVEELDQDADDRIAAANRADVPAQGRYVLVDAGYTYTGTGEGHARFDLRVQYEGSDGRFYSTGDCGAVTPVHGLDQPRLRAGESTSFELCFDVPPEAAQGGLVAVEPVRARRGEERVFWARWAS